MPLLSQIRTFCLFTCCALASGQVLAGGAFKYRTPDGRLVFTDKPMEAPYKLVSAMYLDWGDVKGRQYVPPPVVEEKKKEPEVADKAPLDGTREDRFAAIVNAKASKYRLAPELIHAVIEAESAYNPVAISHAGAVGLMQLMPQTAERLGVLDRADPEQNIEGGAKYLRQLLDLFNNDLTLALAGYNAGEGAVMKYGHKVPPYKETQNYVVKVKEFLHRNIRTRVETASSTDDSSASTPVLKKDKKS